MDAGTLALGLAGSGRKGVTSDRGSVTRSGIRLSYDLIQTTAAATPTSLRVTDPRSGA